MTTERQFAQTVAEHKSTIYTVCYMFSQDADEVNDLFQEGLSLNFKTQRQYQDIIDQIEDLTAE